MAVHAVQIKENHHIIISLRHKGKSVWKVSSNANFQIPWQNWLIWGSLQQSKTFCCCGFKDTSIRNHWVTTPEFNLSPNQQFKLQTPFSFNCREETVWRSTLWLNDGNLFQIYCNFCLCSVAHLTRISAGQWAKTHLQGLEGLFDQEAEWWS